MGKIIKSPNGMDNQVCVQLDIADLLNEPVFFQRDGEMYAYGSFSLAIRNLAWRKLHIHNEQLANQGWKFSDVSVEGGNAAVRFYRDAPVVPEPPDMRKPR